MLTVISMFFFSYLSKDINVKRTIKDPKHGNLPFRVYGFLRSTLRLGK